MWPGVVVVLLVLRPIFISGQAKVVDVSVDTQNAPFNKSMAWAEFFRTFGQKWNAVSNQLKQNSATDLESVYSDILSTFRSGFSSNQNSNNDQSSSTSPTTAAYNTETRRALLYLGLPGYLNTSSNETDSKRLQYLLQKTYPIFVNDNGSYVSTEDNEAVWPVGPNVCLSRYTERVSEDQVNPIKNVTYCTSSRDSDRMQCICWLPVLGGDGAAIRGMRYTTVYSCCAGFGLSEAPTQMPAETSVRQMLDFVDSPKPADHRLCS